ncbi:MAG: hypothetical protein Kow0047_09910 [Anaerolineae bacterium]
MRKRLLVTIALIATLTAILVACALRSRRDAIPAPEAEINVSSAGRTVLMFPSDPPEAAIPTPPPDIVRPILPTVNPQQVPSPTPQMGIPPTPEIVATDIPRSLQHTENILLVGSDQRKPGTPWRTDVIMILAVDRERDRVGVISVPRDLWVKIPGVGWERINTADFYGSLRKDKDGKPKNGVELLKQTLRDNMGIPIHHYVRVDFTVFKDAVDALGGITVTVDCPLRDPIWDKPGQRYRLEPGEYFMDGEEALKYVRSRYTGGDLDRARRQQRVILAMRQRALEINLWPRIPALYRAFSEKIATDLGPLDVIDLARFALTVKDEDIHGFVIGRPMVRDWITPGGAMVLVPDFRQIRKAIDGLFDSPPLFETNDRTNHCP